MLPPTFIQQQGEPWWENTIASTTHSSIPQASTYCPQCCGGEVGVLGWGWGDIGEDIRPSPRPWALSLVGEADFEHLVSGHGGYGGEVPWSI